MKTHTNDEFLNLYSELKKIQKHLLNYAVKNKNLISKLPKENKASAENLIHYLALRGLDLKDLQLRLSFVGLSSLGRSEGSVLHNIEEILQRLEATLQFKEIKSFKNKQQTKSENLTWLDAETILHTNTHKIFGQRPENRHVYIMVTAPECALVNKTWSEKILMAGTNLVRINCAHENPREWKKIIATLRQSSKKLKIPIRILMDLGGPKIRVDAPEKIKVQVGDLITLGGSSKAKRHIVCSIPEVIDDVELGHRVLFDDGKFEGIVTQIKNKFCQIEITRTPGAKDKIRIEKGINFPDSHLHIPEVTTQDLQHLKFVAQNADLVGISFVQSRDSIRLIRSELARMKKEKLGIVLKIETRAGFENFPQLLLESMHHFPVAVMIARGDLAVEVGFERMVEIQEEILWLCEAAHVPVIWATQVLESLAKQGLASRAEVTDAGHAVHAECVMLNKGPYIERAIRVLDDILFRMEKHYYKKRNLYRKLNVVDMNFSEKRD